MWKSCCCQKSCAYPFYYFDPFSQRQFFWAGLVSTKIVYGFEALYRPTPTRKRWLTKTIFYESFSQPGQLVSRRHFAVTFNQFNGRITIQVFENTNDPNTSTEFYPELPVGTGAPATVTQPNSMGLIVFNEGNYNRDGVTFTADETHAECRYTRPPFGTSEHWTIELSDEYTDDDILNDFKTLNEHLAFSPADFGLSGVGLDGIPIGNFSNANRYFVTSAYNDCPVNKAILFPPLLTLDVLKDGLHAATRWPEPVIVKALSATEPVPFPFALYTYQNPGDPITYNTFTWDRPLESFGGNYRSTYPTLSSCWVKCQLDLSCGDFCGQQMVTQGPGGGPAPVLPDPDPVCDTAEKIPWTKPPAWPADFKLQIFRRSRSAPPLFPGLRIANPTHTFELKPGISFPPYDQDPYHIFFERSLISADPQQIFDTTGVPCDCMESNPLP